MEESNKNHEDGPCRPTLKIDTSIPTSSPQPPNPPPQDIEKDKLDVISRNLKLLYFESRRAFNDLKNRDKTGQETLDALGRDLQLLNCEIHQSSRETKRCEKDKQKRIDALGEDLHVFSQVTQQAFKDMKKSCQQTVQNSNETTGSMKELQRDMNRLWVLNSIMLALVVRLVLFPQ